MAEIEQWNQKDVTARNYIFATLAKPMKENLYSCESAAAMWTKLDTQYKLKAAENLHLLWQSFYDFNYHPGNLKIYIYRSIQHLFSIFTTGDDMTVHIQKLSSIADKLKELGQPLDNMQLVTKALATIPEKFRIVRSVWANVPLNERTIDNLLQRLRLEENVVKSYENSDTTDHTAFSAHHHNRTKGGHNPRKHGNSHTVRGTYQQFNSRRNEVRCGYCYIRGHETKDCRKKKRAEAERNTNKDHAFLSSSSSNPESAFAFFCRLGRDQTHV